MPTRPVPAAGAVLATLAAGQFLMALDGTVMNVSIATVAKDVGTGITGVQAAITAYTLVMASLMITGSKVGAMIGHRRAFALGCVIYGAGSAVTAIAPSLPVLLLGWSLLEGIGAALILPAIVALVAGSFPAGRRAAAYGSIAAAGAAAVAVGPLLGGVATTYFSWRWVFVGEVVLVVGIRALSRRVDDPPPPSERPRIDGVGAVLSIVGLSALVFAVLRSSEWGWLRPHPNGPEWLHMSPVLWLLTTAALVLLAFYLWEQRLEETDREPLLLPSMLRSSRLRSGLAMFFFQFVMQAGIFFVIPLYLSVSLGLSALEAGIRIVPMSFALLIMAFGIPRLRPDASPRRVVRAGILCMIAGTLVLIASIDADAGPEIVTWPMLLIGTGIGALASQLGNIVVSAVPKHQAADVGGIQNTVTNLGASLGSALAGAVLIGALSTSLVAGSSQNASIPERVRERASVELASGVPFLSDADLKVGLRAADVPSPVANEILAVNSAARLDALRAALGVITLLGLLSLCFTGGLPAGSKTHGRRSRLPLEPRTDS